MSHVCIDFSAIRHNIGECRRLLAPRTRLCLLFKCDAYGHGHAELAQYLRDDPPDAAAFETNDEARTLRQVFPSLPLLRLYAATRADTLEATAWDVEETIVDPGHAEMLAGVARETGRAIKVHVDIDTGMGRLGILHHEAPEFIAKVAHTPGLSLVGMMTHCPVADAPGDDFTRIQRDRMLAARAALESRGLSKIPMHMAASAAIFVSPDYHFDMVRLGVMAFGGYASPWFRERFGLRAGMQWEARLVTVRDLPAGWSVGYGRTHVLERPARVATLDVGYAYGYLRDFSAKAHVLVGGCRVPVLGRVSMNLVTVDVSTVPGARAGDTAVLLGRQGEQGIDFDDLAGWANTIPNEIMTLVGRQNRRIYGPAPA